MIENMKGWNLSFLPNIKKKLNIFLYEKFGLRITRSRIDVRRKDKPLQDLLLRFARDDRIGQQIEELYILHYLVTCAESLPGDIAEVGVYRGGSAKFIATLKGNRTLHLFDSFQGMLETTQGKDFYQKGDFADTSYESVKQYLHEFPNICFYPGWFPQTAEPVKDRIFSFVHLDVDLYQSTLKALMFFYSRLVSGGFLLSHDFHSVACPGVAQAFHEFFQDKPESILVFPQSLQCAVQKL